MDNPSTLPIQPTTLPMQFGISLGDPWSVVPFVACLAAAIGLVYLFCQRHFDDRSCTETGDYVDQLLPRQLATPRSRPRQRIRSTKARPAPIARTPAPASPAAP